MKTARPSNGGNMRLSGGYKIWESIVKVDNGDQDLGATEGKIYI